MLSDPECTAVIAVAKAEELAVTETGQLRDALRESIGLPLARVVANALEPDRFSPHEARLLEAHAGHPAVARALSGHARARRQRAQLARLRRLTGGVAPAHLPLHPRGPDLRRLADELEPQL
jgi:anion-transporting  ArsA/GET3 family ATPase